MHLSTWLLIVERGIMIFKTNHDFGVEWVTASNDKAVLCKEEITIQKELQYSNLVKTFNVFQMNH